jgi:2-methylcitrate dehydratase PrpD
MYATEVLAEFGAACSGRALTPSVERAAKRALVDWYASVFPGFETVPVRLLTKTLSADFGPERVPLVAGGQTNARTAALINGAAAHAAEVDDSFREGMYHPGAATIAAALAAGQEVGADGAAFLRAVVAGYEISTRIGVVLGRAHYRYWHNAGTVGTFGAAAAAACLYGLDARAYAHALATVATFAAGLQQAFRMDSMSKPLHTGRAAEAGVLAAALARRGLTGSLDVLDGSDGLGRAMSDGPDWSSVGATLGQIFNIERLTFKNHIGCGHTFQAIDGVIELQRGAGLAVAEIARVRIGTYKPALNIACYGLPTTANEARFSFPFVVATALIHGSVRMGAFEASRLADPEIRSLMQRIEVVVDPELDALFPRQRAARIAIDCHDGRRFQHFQPNRKGDPEDPLTDDDLTGKFRELASPVIGVDNADTLLGRLWSAETAAALDW